MSENGSWNNNPGNNNPYGESNQYVPGQYSNNQYNQGSYDSQQGQNPYAQQNNADYRYQPQQYQQPAAYSSYSQYGQPSYSNGVKPAGHGLGIAALVLGIVSILTCWLFGLGALLGLVGTILGIFALVKLGKTPGSKKGMAITGLVLSIIGGLIGTVFLIATIAFGGLVIDGMQECNQYINDDAAYEQCLDDWANDGVLPGQGSGTSDA